MQHRSMLDRRQEFAFVALFFVVLTAAATFPLANVFHPVLPDSDDAEFSVWRLSWIAHQLVADPAHLFDGNIFHPHKGTLAYSDAMLGLGVAGAPLIWSGLHPVLVHNVLMIAALATAGVAMFALCRAITGDTLASVLGGVVFAFAPYRFAHIGHLELQWTAFMPLTLMLLHKLIEQKPRRVMSIGIGAGVLVALQGFSSLYYLVFFAIYLAGWFLLSLILTPGNRRRSLIASGSMAAVTAILLLAPYLSVYARARQILGPRGVEEIQEFSARPSDYLHVSSGSKTYRSPDLDAQDERSLFPGFVPAGLAVFGVLFSRNRMRLVYAALAVWSIDLSLGVNGYTYPLLLRLAPVLSSFRAPARFGILVLLSLAVLGAIGLSEIRRRVRATAKGVVAALAVLICLVEYWAAPISTRADPLKPSSVYRWLATQTDKVILEFPTTQPDALWRYESWYAYNSLYHWRRLVNGYSGYAPGAFLETMQTIKDGDPRAIAQRLRALGVDYLVLHESLYTPAAFAEALSFLANLPGAGPPLTFMDPKDPAVVIPFSADLILPARTPFAWAATAGRLP